MHALWTPGIILCLFGCITAHATHLGLDTTGARLLTTWLAPSTTALFDTGGDEAGNDGYYRDYKDNQHIIANEVLAGSVDSYGNQWRLGEDVGYICD